MAATKTKAPGSATANGNGAVTGIHRALIAAQMEMPAVDRDGVNPHFNSKFTTLGNLIAKVRPVLNKHGLGFSQLPSTDDEGRPTLVTVIFHESGEKLEFEALLFPSKTDPQGLGSAITYMRRYALASALGISDQDDDDGAAGSAPAAKGKAAPKAKAKPRASERPVTAAQQGKLNALYAESDLTKDEATALVLWTSGQPIQDRLSSKQASALIDALEDGGAPELMGKLQAAAEDGEEKAVKAWALVEGGGEDA